MGGGWDITIRGGVGVEYLDYLFGSLNVYGEIWLRKGLLMKVYIY